jgi:hypothetical protein
MEHYDKDTNNNNPDKKTNIRSEMNRRFITTIALPTLLLLLTLISAEPTNPVQATVSSNQTEATPAPGGASVGPAGGGTNVTQSACLPQNATTTGRPAIDAGAAKLQTIQQRLLHPAVLAYTSNIPYSISSKESAR